jgi:hypothetical protein
VLNAPDSSGGGVGGGDNTNITLRVSDRDAANLAFTADNGKVWIVLRPPAGAHDSRPSTVTLQTLLAGTRPINQGN